MYDGGCGQGKECVKGFPIENWMDHEGDIELTYLDGLVTHNYNYFFGMDEISTQDSIWGIEASKTKRFLNFKKKKFVKQTKTEDTKKELAYINFY